MNIKKYYTQLIILSTLIISVFSSCVDDYFDTENGARITPDQHYNSFVDAELSYSGCFVFLQDIAENMVLVDGLRSDQLDVTENADRDMIDINRHDFSTSNPYLDPSAFYKMIINVNEVLPNLEQIMAKDRDFDTVIHEAYKGALITLRSWAYFNLARLNGEVGLVDGNLSTIDPSKPPVYLTKSEIIDKLIEELLPFYDENDLIRYPVDQYALLGELYLEKRDYGNAIKYLKYCCDGASKGIEYMVEKTFQQEAWPLQFFDATQNQQYRAIITAVPYSFATGQKNNLEEWMNYKFKYQVKPVEKLVLSYLNQIQNSGDTADIYRLMGTIGMTEDQSFYVQKYSIDAGIPHSADVILYRDADIHLLLAEALNRNGQIDNALLLLNDGFSSLSSRPKEFSKWSKNLGVRGRVYLKAKTVPDGTNNPTEYVEDLIMQERAMELAFEEKRWFDLVRVAERRNNPAYLADKVAAKFGKSGDPDYDYVHDKLMNPANWYLPLARVNK